jgi:alkylhydroperoxidase/carboxymuconolactone decarboxylase family protein YurZ
VPEPNTVRLAHSTRRQWALISTPGVLEPKLVELMAVAVVASCTHLYTPGIRRHVHGAFAQGATIEEIMDVLKLCGSLGVDALDIGAPILAEELAEHQNRG